MQKIVYRNVHAQCFTVTKNNTCSMKTSISKGKYQKSVSTHSMKFGVFSSAVGAVLALGAPVEEPSFFENAYYYVKDAFTPIQRPSGRFSDVVPSIEEISGDIELTEPILQRLKNRTFFRIFKVDLSKECPFWAAEAMCNNPEYCSVCECADEDIPKVFKERPIEEFVDKRHGSFIGWNTPKNTFSPSFDLQKDDHFTLSIGGEAEEKATYVDLKYNRPGYTSYRGGPIWRLVYEENCRFEETCTEGDDYRRLISGMQSNIASLASEYFDKANNNNPRWFFDKLAGHKDRLENLYFTYALLLRTACLVSPILDDVPFDTGNERDDRAARADVFQLLNTTFASCRDEYIDNHVFHGRTHEAVSQIQNVTAMLDCVECEKCRLHGKLKLTALQLAIRQASSDPYYQVQKLERNEITALMNALAYFSHSIKVIDFMEERMTQRRHTLMAAVVGVLSLLHVAYKLYGFFTGKDKQKGIEHAKEILREAQGLPRKAPAKDDKKETAAEASSISAPATQPAANIRKRN